MNKSFGLIFHLKKTKNLSVAELTVYVRVTVNGVYAEISTKRKCNVFNWNIAAGRMNGKGDVATTFNAYEALPFFTGKINKWT